MNKREVLELKRRFTKSGNTFSMVAGCYVDGEKNKICTFSSPFGNLDENEFYKYLEIASKTLSGALNDHLLNIRFPDREEQPGGHQKALMGIRESRLLNPELLDAWYDMVIASYEHTGNYLILLYYDRYDVPLKTSDGFKTGESVEVYSYILCSICPVELSKPGLGYIATEQRIGARMRDWVVEAPESGFLFPSFDNRSANIHHALVYTKDAKYPHKEVMDKILGCGVEVTSTQKCMTFEGIVRKALGESDERTEDQLLTIQRNLSDLKEQHDEAYGDEKDAPPMYIDEKIMEDAMTDTGIGYDKKEKIKKNMEQVFSSSTPEIEELIDKRALHANRDRIEKNEIERDYAVQKLELLRTKDEMEELRKEREELLKDSGNASETANEPFDISLKLNNELAGEIRTEYVDGERYILIPYSGYESIGINGEEAEL